MIVPINRPSAIIDGNGNYLNQCELRIETQSEIVLPDAGFSVQEQPSCYLDWSRMGGIRSEAAAS